MLRNGYVSLLSQLSILGNFYRDGKLYTTVPTTVNDHDFKSFAKEVVIPHGLYDVQLNKAMINIGSSCDTGEFACDSLRQWWYSQGQQDYPNADSILLVDEIGVEIRVAHYPAYCSKYNPIEHRLFPHVTRACQGVVFASIDLVMKLIKRTKTEKGLRVVVNLIKTVYKTGRKCATVLKRICLSYLMPFCPNGIIGLHRKTPNCMSYLIFVP